ncbi:MAG TPA: hypothetical protein VH744_08660, partial [Terriglobales bacterium]
NKARLWGVHLDFPKSTTQVTYNVTTADNTSNTYDLCLYTGSAGGTGTLAVHTGSTAGTTFAPSTGPRTLSWTGGGGTFAAPQRMYVALTTSCTSSCAVIAGDNATAATFLSNAQISVASGGTCPATVTLPADSWSYGSSVPTLGVE